MKKILIALDYDPTAQKIAESGFSVGKAMGATVVLLHVVSDPVYYANRSYNAIMGFTGYLEIDTVESDKIKKLKEASLHYLSQVKQHLGDETIETLVGAGDFAECILQTAKKEHADMIVIGSHSQKWLEKILIGSVTEKVLSQSTIPLLIIPTKKL